MGARILVVDDEENIRLVLKASLSKHGYDVQTAASAKEALEMMPTQTPDFVITDVRMPDMTGIEMCEEMKRSGSSAVVIVMSAFGSVDLAIEAMKAGAYDYISKPFKQDELLLVLRKAEEREHLRRENRRLRSEVEMQSRFADMFGQSETMQQLFRVIARASEYKTTVLIHGESGTGKELVARALHKTSPRASKPFVAINCGAIPSALLESELFGHKRGAFTDAVTDKAGLFEEANEGTIFLDEIGELPLQLQVKLLRVLQESQVRRIGENKDRGVDVRVIAATVRDLELEVKEGRFREDLFYRLNVLAVRVPPLRDRKEDIPLLVAHFIEKNASRLGTKVKHIGPDAMALLAKYPWPGNVRELENTIERASVLAEGDTLIPSDLPDRIQPPHDPVALTLSTDNLSIKRATEFMEQTLIRRALERTGGNRTAAAKLLEISHRALLYKLKDYGISK